MQTVYILFVCNMLNGQPMPPCNTNDQSKFPTAASCKEEAQNRTNALSPDFYTYADGSKGRADRDIKIFCMSETTGTPATKPLWRVVP